MITFVVFIIAIFIILYLHEWFKKVTGKDPPGPIGLPPFGSTFFMGSSPMKTLHALCDKYGKIMKINLYGNDYYILNDIETINEAFVKQGENFSGRPVDEFSVFGKVFGEQMVVLNENNFFNIHRKFILSKLSTLGMGKSFFDDVLINECDSLIAKIEKLNGNSFDIMDFLLNHTSNIIYGVIFSKSFSFEDTMCKAVRNASKAYYAAIPQLDAFYTGKWFYLKKRLEWKIYNNMIEAGKILHECTSLLFRERLNSQKDDETKRDLLDYYIDAYKNDSTGTFTEDAIIGNLNLFLLDIPEGAVILFYQFIYLMTLNPGIQQKVQNEIDEIIGKDNEVSYQHKPLMNYTQAVISEIERYLCFIPLGLVRVNHNETTLNGFKIPKRSKFIANHWSVSRDKRYFKNPDAFDPNNFLNEKGVFEKSISHIPFSTGKRQCAGMKLAEVENFITFVKLMQKFTWKADGDISTIATQEGIVRQLDSFKIKAFKR